MIQKCFFFGLAATGFAILFAVPARTLLPVFIMGALGGITKFILLHYHFNIIVSTLVGSAVIGFLSIPFAHFRHAPPAIFAIPAVIPMVPGVLAYKMMSGLIVLASDANPALHTAMLADTVHYGLQVMFILISLAVGVELPLLITRKQSAKGLIKRSAYKDLA